jgi:hypothetical protein
VEGAVVAEGVEVELERFRLHQKFRRGVVDHQMGEVGLAGDRAQRREFRRGETGEIIGVGVRIVHAVEHGLFGRRRDARSIAEL